MSNIAFYLDTRRAKKDGTFPVKLYVNHHKRFNISTPFSSTEANWDVNQYTKAEPNYKAKNISIRSMMNKAEEVIYSLEREGRLKSTSDSTLRSLIEAAISGKERSTTALSALDEFTTTKRRDSTAGLYKMTRAKIEGFAGDCQLGDIDRRWLMAFDDHMEREGLSVNTRSIHMRNLRAVFNYAIDEGLTSNYPFRKFSIKTEETRKRSLSADQLATFRDYPCEKGKEMYRDIFMLMFYLIGINAIDLFLAPPDAIRDGRLEYKRAKTGKLYSIKVEPEAMEIIERYKGKDHLLDVMDRYSHYKDFSHRMGENLKKIGRCERSGRGGKKSIEPLFPDLSPYWARHTWATIAAGLDIPKETISEALGHEIGLPITSIYIKFDQRKVDEANRRVIDYVNATKGAE